MQSQEGLVGGSPAFRRMLELVSRGGPSKAAVLLVGESGTGKEPVARALHESRTRARVCSSWWNVHHSPKRSSRANCSATKRAPSPGPRPPRRDWSNLPVAAPCSWTRWAIFPSADAGQAAPAGNRHLSPRGRHGLRQADIRIVSATHRTSPTSWLRGNSGRFAAQAGRVPHPPAAFARAHRGPAAALVPSLLSRVAPDRAFTVQTPAWRGSCITRSGQHP